MEEDGRVAIVRQHPHLADHRQRPQVARDQGHGRTAHGARRHALISASVTSGLATSARTYGARER